MLLSIVGGGGGSGEDSEDNSCGVGGALWTGFIQRLEAGTAEITNPVYNGSVGEFVSHVS